MPIKKHFIITLNTSFLTHWGRVTHICVSDLTSIGSDNGLSPGRHQAIIRTNAGILLIGTLGTNFCEILSEIHTFSFKKIHLKMLSGKYRPFCLGLNVLNINNKVLLKRCWWWRHYLQTSKIWCTFVGNKIVDHSDVVGASTAPTIYDLTPGFNGLGEDNCKMRWETFKFLDLVSYIRRLMAFFRMVWVWWDHRHIEVWKNGRYFADNIFIFFCLDIPRVPVHNKYISIGLGNILARGPFH